MQLHELQPKTVRKSTKRVGRGGKRGKTSGRGHKGQKARAGNSGRPELRDMIKKLPKLRGHGKNRARTVHSGRIRPEVVNVGTLEKIFDQEGEINPTILVSKELIVSKKGRALKVKILGNGDLSKKLVVSGCEVSASAREKIEAAGGSISK